MSLPSTSRLRLCAGLAWLVAIGCGGESPAPAVDVTGTWAGTVRSSAGPPGYEPVFGDYVLTLRLVQSGSTVSGTLSSVGAFSGAIVGGVSGSRAQLAVTIAPCGGPGVPGGTVTLSGTVQDHGPAAPTLDVAYEGTPCGVGDYGVGTLTRQ